MVMDSKNGICQKISWRTLTLTLSIIAVSAGLMGKVSLEASKDASIARNEARIIEERELNHYRHLSGEFLSVRNEIKEVKSLLVKLLERDLR